MAQAHRGVFISWSKETALQVAKELQPFLEDVLGHADIFMSSSMAGGDRWAMEIPKNLEVCNAGLIIVTKENSHAPWLQFEAGALSKNIDESRVIPLLFGAELGDIQGTPLTMFQAKELNHDNLLDVCLNFGQSFDVDERAVRRRFERGWTAFEAELGKIEGPPQPKKSLGIPDLMAVLERVASQVATIENAVRPSSRAYPLVQPTTLRDLTGISSVTDGSSLSAGGLIDKLLREQARKLSESGSIKDPGADSTDDE